MGETQGDVSIKHGIVNVKTPLENDSEQNVTMCSFADGEPKKSVKRNTACLPGVRNGKRSLYTQPISSLTETTKLMCNNNGEQKKIINKFSIENCAKKMN